MKWMLTAQLREKELITIEPQVSSENIDQHHTTVYQTLFQVVLDLLPPLAKELFYQPHLLESLAIYIKNTKIA